MVNNAPEAAGGKVPSDQGKPKYEIPTYSPDEIERIERTPATPVPKMDILRAFIGDW